MEHKKLETLTESLVNNGYAIFDLPFILHRPASIMNGFKQLLAEDEQVKEKWKFFLPEVTKKPDHGLIPPKGAQYDQKWFLMYRQSLPEMLKERFSNEYLIKYLVFFLELQMVQEYLLNCAYEIAQAIDQKMPGYAVFDQLKNPSLNETHVTRLVEYIYKPDTPISEPMASLHTDQSFLTMQWFQSHPGLILRDYHGNEIKYEYSQGRVIIFFGKKAIPVFSSLLKPVEHWVDSRALENRYSGILFIHTAHPSIEMR